MYNTIKEPDKRDYAHESIDEWAEKKKKGEIIVRFDGSGDVRTVERHDVH